MKQKRRSKKTFGTLYTVLVTLLFAAIIVVVLYAWRTLGLSAHSVSYSSTESDVVGTLPEKRDFEAGDEVVVRAGSFTRKDYTFAGWKDVNGAIANNTGTLENGAVFIMPDSDVVLEPIWEAAEPAPTEETTTTKDSKSNVSVYTKKEGKDYINIRSTYGYDGKVVTKVSDSDTKIEYSGKSESIYDDDDKKTYTWYYVNIPSKEKEGWVRSDMLSETSSSSSASSSSSNSSDETYVKSQKYDSVSLYQSADANSETVSTIDNEETALIFTGKTKDAENSSGNTVTWYFVKDSSTGKSGWIEKSKIQHVSQ